MKFEFSADIKGVPAAQVRCCIDCTAEELSIMLSDPAYQGLAEVLIKKLSQQNHRSTNDRFEHMRRVYEADRTRQNARDAAVDTAIKGLQDQLNRMFNRVINTKF